MIKGSWEWAISQMKLGRIIYGKTFSGTVKYRLDSLKSGRIIWNFDSEVTKGSKWESANIFISDFTYKDWDVVKRVVCKLKKKEVGKIL